MRPLLALLALLAACSAAAGEWRVALGIHDSHAPARESGGLPSFNEEMARELCRRASARCSFVNSVFSEILPGIESGRFDLGFGNYLRTPEREKRVAFSDPIWRSSSRLVATSDSSQRFNNLLRAPPSLDKLSDARIAAIEDSQQLRFLQALPAERRLTPLPARTMADAMELLRSGRADFALFPMLSAYALIQREAPGRFEFVGPAMQEGGLGGSVHIALPRDKEELRRAINQALAEMRADGTYHRIARRHFTFNME